MNLGNRWLRVMHVIGEKRYPRRERRGYVVVVDGWYRGWQVDNVSVGAALLSDRYFSRDHGALVATMSRCHQSPVVCRSFELVKRY